MKNTFRSDHPVFRICLPVLLSGMIAIQGLSGGWAPAGTAMAQSKAVKTSSASKPSKTVKPAVTAKPATAVKPAAAAKLPAAGKTAASAIPAAAGIVKTPQGSIFSWEGAYEMPGETGNVLRFSVKINNQSKTDLDLMNYWVKLTSKGGSSFSVQLLPQDRGKSRVGRGLSDTLTFYATVPSRLGWDALSVQLIRWDFGKTYFQTVLGVLKPFGPSPMRTVPVNGSGSFDVSGIVVRNKLLKWSLQTAEANTRSASIEWELENLGIRAVDMPAYSYLLRTANGLYYPLTAAQQESNLLNPQTPKTIILNGTVPAALPVQGLQLWITQQVTGNTSGSLAQTVTIPVQVMNCPEPVVNGQISPKQVVPAGKDGEWTWNSQTVRMTAGSLTTKKNGQWMNVQAVWNMENRGSSDLPNPEFTMILRNKNGLQYPLTVTTDSEPAEKSWLPLTQKSFKGRVSLPAGVDLTGSQLWVYTAASKDAKGNPLPPAMMFALPDPVADQTSNQTIPVIAAGQAWTDPNGDNGLTYQLNEWYRLPWDETDQVVIRLRISHTSAKSLPLSSLTPQIWLDDLLRADAKWINTGGYTSVQPGDGITMYVSAKIPYTQSMQTVQLRLLDKSTELVRLNAAAEAAAVKEYLPQQMHTLDLTGKRMSWKPEQTRVFQTDTQTVVVSWLSVESLEKRYMTPARPVVSLKLPNGILYPSRLSEFPVSGGKFFPNGRALVTVSTILPKLSGLDKMSLWLGEGIADDKPAMQDGTADGWLNVVSWPLQPVSGPVGGLQQMNAYPYIFTLKSVDPLFNENSFSMQFDYSLERDTAIPYLTEDSKLIVEYASEEGKVFWSEELDPEKTGTSATDLPLGNRTFVIQRTYQQLPEPIEYLKTIRLNVYYKVKGAKVLIGSKPVKWITMKLDN